MRWFSSVALTIGILSASVLASLAGSADAMPAGACHSTSKIVDVRFERSGEVITNPGKGWVLYDSDAYVSQEVLDISAVGYIRIDLPQINPSENGYDWGIIDAYKAAWKAKGLQFAFGIVGVNSLTENAVDIGGITYFSSLPQWLIDKGARYTINNADLDPDIVSPGDRRKVLVPVWDDPIYLDACSKLIHAMAERYDGDPDIAYIDMRFYGNWGEMHMIPFFTWGSGGGFYSEYATPDGATHTGYDGLRPDQIQALYLQPFLDAFHITRLVLCCSLDSEAIREWAVENGIGLRQDNIMSTETTIEGSGWLNTPYGEAAAIAAGRTPIAWELITPHVNSDGWNQGIDDIGARDGDAKFLQAVVNNKPSYIGMGTWNYDGNRDADFFYSERGSLVRQIANLMGYHFFMRSARYADTMASGAKERVSVQIDNAGVTCLLLDCTIKLVLLDSDGSLVEGGTFTTDWDAGAIAAGTAADFSAGVQFSAAAGVYQLAIGLFLNETDQAPTYKMENLGRTPDGYYVIGDIRIR